MVLTVLVILVRTIFWAKAITHEGSVVYKPKLNMKEVKAKSKAKAKPKAKAARACAASSDSPMSASPPGESPTPSKRKREPEAENLAAADGRKKLWLDDLVGMTTAALRGVCADAVKLEVKITAWRIGLTFAFAGSVEWMGQDWKTWSSLRRDLANYISSAHGNVGGMSRADIKALFIAIVGNSTAK